MLNEEMAEDFNLEDQPFIIWVRLVRRDNTANLTREQLYDPKFYDGVDETGERDPDRNMSILA